VKTIPDMAQGKRGTKGNVQYVDMNLKIANVVFQEMLILTGVKEQELSQIIFICLQANKLII
jgi:hypothetical protein